MSFLSLLITAFTFVSLWFIFVKAGEEGWKALIPIYNSYILFKISGKAKLCPGYLASSLASIPLLILGYVLLFLGMFNNDELLNNDKLLILSIIFMALSFIASIIGIVLSIKMTIALGHKFGKRGGFIVGMVFLSTIFYGILAFDKSVVYNVDTE